MKVVAGWVAGLLLVIGAGAAGEALAGTNTSSGLVPPALYALISGGPGTHALIAQLSPATGGVVRTVETLPLVPQTGIPDSCPMDPIFVDSLANGPNGELWFDESSGAPCQPFSRLPSFPDDHCSGTLLRLDPVTGASRAVLRTAPTLALSGIAPSPDGRMVALVVGPCSVAANQDWILIDDLSAGRHWVVGSSAPPCTFMSSPVWLSDGAHVAVVVTSYQFYPQVPNRADTCGGTSATHLALLPALTPSAFAAARLVPPIGGGCEDDAISASGSVLLVAQSCGTNDGAIDRGSATVRSVTLDGVLKSTFRLPPRLFVVALCVRRSSTAVVLAIAQALSPSAFGPSLEIHLSILRGHRLRELPLAPSVITALAC